MISCALTLPTFGNASSSADTFILPRTSSLSASLSTWVRLVPPRLSRSLSSARARSPPLEPILYLCWCPTRGSSLLQRGRALLVGQLGKGHDSSVSHR